MPTRRVSEAAPVQVYLAAAERRRLDRLAEQLDVSKSEVLRRGLLALEHELTAPDAHPALRLIGIAPTELPHGDSADAARAHDEVLTVSEVDSWAPRQPRRRGKRRAR